MSSSTSTKRLSVAGLDCYVSGLNTRNKISVIFEQYVQVSWLLNRYVLRENEASPITGQQCRYCLIANANCRMEPCQHFLCLDCVYSMRELVIHNCNCGVVINLVMYYTTDSQHRFATTTVRRLLIYQRLLKAFFIPVTRNFRPTQNVQAINYIKKTSPRHILYVVHFQ